MIKRRNSPFSFSAEDFDESVDSFGAFDPFHSDAPVRHAAASDAGGQAEGGMPLTRSVPRWNWT
jgi:putative transcriptional regulator